MIKITFVVPYAELAQLAYDTFKEHNEFEDLYRDRSRRNEYTLECIVAIGYEVKNIKLDTDVIIARGVTAEILKSSDDYIPVVEVTVAGNDLIECLYESKKRFGEKKVAVIGAKSMIFGAEALSKIVGLEIKSYVLNYFPDGPKLVDKSREDGCEVIIGGIRTCEYANVMGLSTVLIKTGKESLWQAITEAKRIAYISRREQEKAQRYKTILDYAYEGIIATDTENNVSIFNSTAQKALAINDQDVYGRKIGEVIPQSKLMDLIQTDCEHLDEIINYKDVQLAVNKVPILLKGDSVGSVITFQDITRVQELEGKIRNKIYSRGLVAKYTFSNIIGNSKKITEAIDTAKRFSITSSNILIVGNTGSGKELFAQSMHNYSKRSKGPFVAVNCAALPESILESELFGYVGGAFTGASKGIKPGLFELAHMGTIFLDEISEVSTSLQGRLLRVIQEKEIMRLGDDKVIPVDVRIISATNKNLYAMVRKGDFREDLYYRLDVLKIVLPDLNERREDIPLIVEDYMKRHGINYGKDNIVITKGAVNMIRDFDWTGNIRELRNICERLLALCRSNAISEKDVELVLLKNELVDSIHDRQKRPELERSNFARERQLDNIQREEIIEILRQTGYSIKRTADIIGIDRTTLWRRMKKLNIK